MNKKDIEKGILDSLKEIMAGIDKNIIFYNEEQFQFDLATKFKMAFPKYDVLFEIKTNDQIEDSAYIDLTIYDNNDNSYYCAELKYKKSNKYVYETKYGEIILPDDKAQDIGRYLFLYDVSRVEKLVANKLKPIQCDRNYKKCVGGCAIMLTNDDNYWRCPAKMSGKLSKYDAFKIRHGDNKLANTVYGWAKDSSALGKKNLKNPIIFSSNHEIEWSEEHNHFRYLIVYNDR